MKFNKKYLIIIIITLFVFISFYYDKDETDLGNGCIYNSKRRDIIGKINIPPKIIIYSFNDDFILVKQKPKDFDNIIYGNDVIYPLGRDFIYYWLVVKKEEKLFGPIMYDSLIVLKEYYKINLNLN